MILISKFYKKWGWVLITTVLLLWIILTPSHFQKGGVDRDFYVVIALFVTAISVLLNWLFAKMHWLERIIVPLVFAFLSLFLTSLIIVPFLIDVLYNDKSWFFWETRHRILINTIYYGLNVVVLLILSSFYFKVRGGFNERKRCK